MRAVATSRQTVTCGEGGRERGVGVGGEGGSREDVTVAAARTGWHAPCSCPEEMKQSIQDPVGLARRPAHLTYPFLPPPLLPQPCFCLQGAARRSRWHEHGARDASKRPPRHTMGGRGPSSPSPPQPVSRAPFTARPVRAEPLVSCSYGYSARASPYRRRQKQARLWRGRCQVGDGWDWQAW